MAMGVCAVSRTICLDQRLIPRECTVQRLVCEHSGWLESEPHRSLEAARAAKEDLVAVLDDPTSRDLGCRIVVHVFGHVCPRHWHLEGERAAIEATREARRAVVTGQACHAEGTAAAAEASTTNSTRCRGARAERTRGRGREGRGASDQTNEELATRAGATG